MKKKAKVRSKMGLLFLDRLQETIMHKQEHNSIRNQMRQIIQHLNHQLQCIHHRVKEKMILFNAYPPLIAHSKKKRQRNTREETIHSLFFFFLLKKTMYIIQSIIHHFIFWKKKTTIIYLVLFATIVRLYSFQVLSFLRK
jgi:hypothetical protein